jgi:hypothetical protein
MYKNDPNKKFLSYFIVTYLNNIHNYILHTVALNKNVIVSGYSQKEGMRFFGMMELKI